MNIRINKMVLKTPSEDIIIKHKVDENSVLSEEEFKELADVWETGLTKGNFFTLPTQYNKVYLLPKYILEHSYLVMDIEEVE